jgi:hypothetical protein
VQVAHAHRIGKWLIQRELREVIRNSRPGPKTKNPGVYRLGCPSQQGLSASHAIENKALAQGAL